MIEVNYNEYKETLADNMKLIVENHRLEEVEKEHQKLNGELREEIERLNNIIKEVREYMKTLSDEYAKDDYDMKCDVFNKLYYQILDKENKDEQSIVF